MSANCLIRRFVCLCVYGKGRRGRERVPRRGEAIPLFGAAGSCVSGVASKRTVGVVDNVFFCAVLSRHICKQTGRVWGGGGGSNGERRNPFI